MNFLKVPLSDLPEGMSSEGWILKEQEYEIQKQMICEEFPIFVVPCKTLDRVPKAK